MIMINHHKEKPRDIIVVFLVFLAVLLVHSYIYLPFISDDALISLRYLDRFLQGHGLTWTDGIRVEGYSNLLWILLLSLPGVFKLDLIVAARIVGVAGMAVVILSVLLFYTRANTLKQIWLPLLTGLLFFCLAVPIAAWAIGGLEQPLYAALLGVAIPLCIAVIASDTLHLKKTLLASLLLGLLCITRPDGPIFTVAAIAAFILAWRYPGHKQPLQTIVALLVFPVVFYAGQIGFRFYYYGELVPNTALVKLAFSKNHVIAGMQYVARGLLSLAPFSLFALASLFVALRFQQYRGRALLLLAMLALWLLYVVIIGGDVFPAWRHFIPVIVIFTFAIIDGTFLVSKYIEHKNSLIRPALLVGLTILFVLYLLIQCNDPKNKKVKFERWEWDGQVVGLLLKTAFTKQQPLIAVTAAGCLPYWSGLPALDMLGLNDYYLPRHPPKHFGQGSLGHELGSGAYVMDSKPDIIIFHTGLEKDVFRSGLEMQATDAFYENYAAVKVLGTVPHQYRATLWMRKYSDKIGIHQTAFNMEIPGYLLNAHPDTVAYLNARDELVVSVVKGQPAGFNMTLPLAGEWNCQAQASAAGVSCKLTSDSEGSRIRVETSSDTPIEIVKLMLTKNVK
jgi:arabinofuranosyltransferase